MLFARRRVSGVLPSTTPAATISVSSRRVRGWGGGMRWNSNEIQTLKRDIGPPKIDFTGGLGPVPPSPTPLLHIHTGLFFRLRASHPGGRRSSPAAGWEPAITFSSPAQDPLRPPFDFFFTRGRLNRWEGVGPPALAGPASSLSGRWLDPPGGR